MYRTLLALTLLSFFIPGLALAKKGLVTVPSLCHRVDRVEGNRVYVASPATPCDSHEMRALVELPENVAEAEVYVDGTYWRTFPVHNPQQRIVRGMEQQGRAAAEHLRPQQGSYIDPAAYGRGQSVASQMTSPQYLARIQQDMQSIQEHFVPDDYMNNLQAAQGPNRDQFGEAATQGPTAVPTRVLGANERLYVFISSSMPGDLLETYMTVAHRTAEPRMVFVLRGFIGGATKIRPTYEFMQNLLRLDPDCTPAPGTHCEYRRVNIEMDPTLYTRFAIDQVPAFAYASDVAPIDPSLVDRASEANPASFSMTPGQVVYGDVSLDYAAATLAHETGAPSLLALADLIRHPLAR